MTKINLDSVNGHIVIALLLLGVAIWCSIAGLDRMSDGVYTLAVGTLGHSLRKPGDRQ